MQAIPEEVRMVRLHLARAIGLGIRDLPDQTIAGYFAELLASAQQGRVPNAHARMLEDMERVLFTQAIQLAQGNQARAARWLGVTRTTTREKLMHFGLRAAAAEPTNGNGGVT